MGNLVTNFPKNAAVLYTNFPQEPSHISPPYLSQGTEWRKQLSSTSQLHRWTSLDELRCHEGVPSGLAWCHNPNYVILFSPFATTRPHLDEGGASEVHGSFDGASPSTAERVSPMPHPVPVVRPASLW